VSGTVPQSSPAGHMVIGAQHAPPAHVPGAAHVFPGAQQGSPAAPQLTAHVSSVATTTDFVQVAGLEHSALVVQATQ
jgi:hypothetical protein